MEMSPPPPRKRESKRKTKEKTKREAKEESTNALLANKIDIVRGAGGLCIITMDGRHAQCTTQHMNAVFSCQVCDASQTSEHELVARSVFTVVAIRAARVTYIVFLSYFCLALSVWLQIAVSICIGSRPCSTALFFNPARFMSSLF